MDRRWIGTTVRGLLSVAGALVLLRACFHFSYQETSYREVFLRDVSAGKYELEFRYHVEISGNMHGPSIPFLSSDSSDHAKWFYVDTTDGSVEASRVVLTQYRACKDSLYWQKDMKGEIVVTPTQVTFALKMPRYDTPDGKATNTVQRYEDWNHNGTYALVTHPSVPPVSDVSGYRPSSCDRGRYRTENQ